jgi:predicted peptidase
MKSLAFAFFIAFLLSACGRIDRTIPESEFPSRVVNVNGIDHAFRVFVPKDRDENEKLPVMLYLHGSNRRGTDNQVQLEDLYENIIGNPQNFRFIIVFPQCREDTFWAGPMMDQAIAALDQTVKEFGGDESRLYLAGFSMGGFGTWQTAITHPTKFAAIIPVAGGVEPLGDVSDEDKALLSPEVTAAASAPNVYDAYASRLSNIGVWIVHGDQDKSVPVEQAQKMAAALRSAGNNNVVYNELKGVGHGSVTEAFADPKLFAWLAEQRR